MTVALQQITPKLGGKSQQLFYSHRLGGSGTRPDGLSLSSVSGASQGHSQGNASSWEWEDQHIRWLLHPPLGRLGSAKTIHQSTYCVPQPGGLSAVGLLT